MNPKHDDVIRQVHAAHPPARTKEGALAFLLYAIAELQWRFPAERVGLLIKTAGENIVPYQGTSVSAGRIVYPDHNLLVKILSDVPTTNGPSWQTEEGIPSTGHHGGYLAVGAPLTEPTQPSKPPSETPPPQSPFVDLSGVLAELADLRKHLINIERTTNATFDVVSRQLARPDPPATECRFRLPRW